VEEFNPRSFINCHEYRTMQEVVERVIEIDRNDDLFLEYLNQPYFHDNVPNEYFDLSTYLSFFEEIISKIDKQVPVARGFRRHFTFRKQKRKIDFFRNRLSNYFK